MLVDQPGHDREAADVERLVGIERLIGDRRDPAVPDTDVERLEPPVGEHHVAAGEREISCAIVPPGSLLDDERLARDEVARGAREERQHVLGGLLELAGERLVRVPGDVRRDEDVRGACEPLELLAGRLRSSTSRTAPPSSPSSSRRRRASSSTMPPRAVLTRIADGFIRPRRSSSSRPRVSSVSATVDGHDVGAPQQLLQVDLLDAGDLPRSLRDHPSTRMPKALPSSATRTPMRPSPTTPSVLPASSKPRKLRYSQLPPRVDSAPERAAAAGRSRRRT